MSLNERLAALPEETRLDALEHLPSDLADQGKAEGLYTLLTTYDFLQAKVDILGIESLIDDYMLIKRLEVISENRKLQRIADALRAGVVLLRQAPEELWNQVKGRTDIALHADYPRPVPRLDLRAATLPSADTALLRILQGHTDDVTHCVLSADGKRALSSSRDKTLRLWNTISGEMTILQAHESEITECALSENGELALFSSGKELRVLNTVSGQTVGLLQGHTDEVTACALSADGKLALSASRDHALDCTLRLWNTANSETVCFFSGHTGKVTACVLSADGKLALSFGSRDHTLRLWDTDSGRQIHLWKFSRYTDMAGCTLSADGRRVLVVSNLLWGVLGRAKLQVWDATTGRRVRTLKGFKGVVTSCALSADGHLALSGAETPTLSMELSRRVRGWSLTALLALFGLFRFLDDFESSTLRVWDIERGKTVRILQGHKGSVALCALSADGKLALSASSSLAHVSQVMPRLGKIADPSDPSEHWALRLWNTASKTAQPSPERHVGPVQDCALSTDGRLALTCAKNDKTLRVWDTEHGKTMRILEGHYEQVASCALSADGKLALSLAADGFIYLWNTTSGERKLVGQSLSPSLSPNVRMLIVECALSADGNLALSPRRGMGLCLWDTTNGQILHTLESQADNQSGCALSADGRRALTVSEDGNLRLWDTVSGQKIAQWAHNTSLPHCILSADGRRVLTVSKDGNLWLWDTVSGRAQPFLEHHAGRVRDCALSTDGRLALFAFQDHTLRLWNTDSEQEIARWTYDIPLQRCTLSADGRIAVVGDIEGGVHFLEVVFAAKAEDVPATPSAQQTPSLHLPQHSPVRGNKQGSGCGALVLLILSIGLYVWIFPLPWTFPLPWYMIALAGILLFIIWHYIWSTVKQSGHPPKQGSGCGALAGLILSICFIFWTFPLPWLVPLPWYMIALVGILLFIILSVLERRALSRGGMPLASWMLSIIVLVLTLCNFALGVSFAGR